MVNFQDKSRSEDVDLFLKSILIISTLADLNKVQGRIEWD